MHIKKLEKIFKGQNAVSWDLSAAKALPVFFYSVYLFSPILKGEEMKEKNQKSRRIPKTFGKTQIDLHPFFL